MGANIDLIVADGYKESSQDKMIQRKKESIIKEYEEYTQKIMDKYVKELLEKTTQQYKQAKNEYIYESERIAMDIIYGFIDAYLPQYDPYSVKVTCNFAGDSIFINCDYSNIQKRNVFSNKKFNENSSHGYLTKGFFPYSMDGINEDFVEDSDDDLTKDLIDEDGDSFSEFSLDSSENNEVIDNMIERLSDDGQDDFKAAFKTISNGNLDGIFVSNNKKYRGNVQEVIQRGIQGAYRAINSSDLWRKISFRNGI